jgi:hypothetical protein
MRVADSVRDPPRSGDERRDGLSIYRNRDIGAASLQESQSLSGASTLDDKCESVEHSAQLMKGGSTSPRSIVDDARRSAPVSPFLTAAASAIALLAFLWQRVGNRSSID